jgi:quinol monooxygenase YgiN
MTQATSVTVVASFQLMPNRHQIWRNVWRELGNIARNTSACHCFRLLRDAADDTRCMVVSEWDDLAAFNRFVRTSHLLWIERSVPYASHPTSFAFMHDIADDAAQNTPTLERELVPAGAAQRR